MQTPKKEKSSQRFVSAAKFPISIGSGFIVRYNKIHRMERRDILLSTVNAEEPVAHSICINGNLFHIAFELQNVVLLGASIYSNNSEYRPINLCNDIMRKLFRGDSKLKRDARAFFQMKKRINAMMKHNAITIGKSELKNISQRGIDYALIYFLLTKYLNYSEEQFVGLNNFSLVVDTISFFNKIFNQTPSLADLKLFAGLVMYFGDIKQRIGSKILLLTRFQIKNTSNLSHSIWKTMYINRIIRNISIQTRQHFLSPALDWGLIQFSSKHLFSNTNLISKIKVGENINYIRTTAANQEKLAQDLVLGDIKNHEFEHIKQLTSDLKESTTDIDYALDDLCLVMFYANRGRTLFNTINSFVDNYKEKKRLDEVVSVWILQPEHFKQLIFQYLYATLLLVRHGIIHNDPHLNNILITKRDSKNMLKLDFMLPNGKVAAMGVTQIELTLIDYDKSILSYHHHNFFNVIAEKINEEIGIVFQGSKKSIVKDFGQVFNCYVMYDIVRFGLVFKRILADMKESIGTVLPSIEFHVSFLDTMIKAATDVMYKIYEPDPKLQFDCSEPYGSTTWLIETLFKDYLQVNKTKSSIDNTVRLSKTYSSISSNQPSFISARRKYAEALKQSYISEYVSKA